MSYERLVAALAEGAEQLQSDDLKHFVGSEHPADLAAFLDALEPGTALAVLELLPLERQAKVFGYLDPGFQVELARAAPRRRVAAIVSEMEADERADLYNTLEEEERERLLRALAQAEREDIRRLAAHAEGTVGAIMTSDYATLEPDLTAAKALDKLRREAPDKETIYRAYVTDAERRLIGSVRLHDLILARPDARIEAIMEREPRALGIDGHQEEAARQIARYDVLALPVVDAEGRLVGIVTHDDAMDVVVAEATEDFHKSGTISRLELSVREATIAALYRARVFWLLVLALGNIFSGAGIAYYEETVAAHVALVFFLPLLIGSGGNAGAQSSTLMVRALATGEALLADWSRMLGRETLVALLLGLTMAAAVSVIGLWRGGPEIALVVAAAMVAVVLFGALVGLTLPFVLTRLKLDPAAASAPLVTTMADIAGVVIYFAIASAVLLPGA